MRPLQQAVPRALAELLRTAPLSPGKVTFAWRAAVGSAVERVTSVRLDRGTLLVDAATREWAREIARSSPVILPRLRFLLGDAAVTRLEVRTVNLERGTPNRTRNPEP